MTPYLLLLIYGCVCGGGGGLDGGKELDRVVMKLQRILCEICKENKNDPQSSY